MELSTTSLKTWIDKCKNKRDEFKKNHSTLNELINFTFEFAPEPFGKFANKLWNGFHDDPEVADKVIDILQKFEHSNSNKLEEQADALNKLIKENATKQDIRDIGEKIRTTNEEITTIINTKLDEILITTTKNLEVSIDTSKDMKKVKKFFGIDKQRKEGFEGFVDAIDDNKKKIRALPQIYVKPKEYDSIIHALNKTHVAIITGSPEYGKTYTAYHILLEYYNKGFTPYHIKIRENQSEISEKLRPISERLFNHEKIAVYLDDPFGHTEYNKMDDRSIIEIKDFINDFNENQNNSILIITSRKYIFDKVQGKILTKNESKGMIIILDLKNESYGDGTKKEFLEKCAKFHNVSWYKYTDLLEFAKSKLDNYLPTMLNIWNFTRSDIEEQTQDDLFDSIKEHSVSTPIRFATQILDGNSEYMYFLTFPFINQWFEPKFVEKEHQEIIKGIEDEFLYEFNKMCKKFEEEISLEEFVTFSHPSYSEALGYLLCSENIPERDQKPEDVKVKGIFMQVIFKLAENDNVAGDVANAVASNFDKLDLPVAEELLFKLAENNNTAEEIVYVVTSNFDKLPLDTSVKLLFKLAENDAVARGVVYAVTSNFDKLDLSVAEELLFKLAENDNAAESVTNTVNKNFDKLPKDTRIKLLFKLAENDNAAGYLANVIERNFDKIDLPEAVELLFKLFEYDGAARGVANAVAYNFDKLPLDTQQLLFKLAENDNHVRSVADAVANNFDKLDLPVAEKLLFKLVEYDDATGSVAFTVRNNFDKILLDTSVKLLFKLAEHNNAIESVEYTISHNSDKIPKDTIIKLQSIIKKTRNNNKLN